MAAFARHRSWTSRARPAGQPGRRPAVRRPRRQDGRAGRVPARRRRATLRRRGPARLRRSSSTRAPRRVPPAVLAARAARRTRPTSRRSCRRGADRAGPPPRPTPRREARAARAGHVATPRRRCRASTPAGWPTRARRWRRSTSSPTRWACPTRPSRIECYDISNFQGAQIGRQHGRLRGRQAADRRVPPLPDQARSRAPNDFASHQEVLRRRFQRARPGEEGSAEEMRWRMPDLVVIDGGKGQVSAAKEVARRARLPRPAAGRAGQGARGAVPARTATTRSCCPRRRRRSISCSGCATRPTASRSRTTATCGPRRPSARPSTTCRASGPKRRRALLRVFGSAKRVREAPVEQIAAVPGHRAGAGRRRSRPAWRRRDRRPLRASTGGRGARGAGRAPPGRTLLSSRLDAKSCPLLIVIIGIWPLCPRLLAGSEVLPSRPTRMAMLRSRSTPSSGSTCRAASRSCTRPQPTDGKTPDSGRPVHDPRHHRAPRQLDGRLGAGRRDPGLRPDRRRAAGRDRHGSRSRSSSARPDVSTSCRCPERHTATSRTRRRARRRPIARASRCRRRRTRRCSVATRSTAPTATTDSTGNRAVGFTLRSRPAQSSSPRTRSHTSATSSRSSWTARSSPRRTSRADHRRAGASSRGSVGGFAASDMNDLVTVLQYGSLPFPVAGSQQ